jgi:hypothetical protein
VPTLHKPGEPIWAPLAPEVLDNLTDSLGRVDELFRRIDVVITTPPAEGSVAAAAEESEIYAYDLVSAGLQSALDHLRAWRTLISAGLVPMYAHMSLLRPAHEMALHAYWVLEPGVIAPTRQARAIAVRAADYKERKNLEESMGKGTPYPGGKLGAERLADLMAKAGHLGLTKLDPKGKTVLKTQVPNAVDLFDLYEPERPPAKGQWRYRFYSGYTHGKRWALTLGAEPAAPFDESGHTIAIAQAHDESVVDATRRCVNAVDRAISAYEQLRT